MTVAELFRTKRVEHRLSLRAAAKLMGTGFGHLCQIECSKHKNLTIRTLLAAQRVYGFTDSELMAAIKGEA